VVVVVVVAVAAGAAQGVAAVVLAEAGTEEEWDTAVATEKEWGTVVGTVRVTASALDLATPALGIRGTTLCQRGAPIRKTLPTKAEIITEEAFPATAARCTLWRIITRLTFQSHTSSCRLTILSRERKKDLLMHSLLAGSSRVTEARN
jgi:hypothetical protein